MVSGMVDWFETWLWRWFVPRNQKLIAVGQDLEPASKPWFETVDLVFDGTRLV